jgi:hypothetical protein
MMAISRIRRIARLTSRALHSAMGLLSCGKTREFEVDGGSMEFPQVLSHGEASYPLK